MGGCLEKKASKESFLTASSHNRKYQSLLSRQSWVTIANFTHSISTLKMSEFKIHHHVSEIMKLLGAPTNSEDGLGAEVYTDLLLKNIVPFFSTEVSMQAAVQKIAAQSSSSQDFMILYKELKSKNVRDLNPVVQFISKLVDDPQTREFLKKTTVISSVPPASTTVKSGTKITSEELSQLKDTLKTATSTIINQAQSPSRIIKEKPSFKSASGQIPHFPNWMFHRPYLTWNFVTNQENTINNIPVGQLGTVPLETQEYTLLENLLFCLEGIDGDHIHAFPSLGSHECCNFTVDESIDASLKELTYRILPICANYSIIVKFIEDKAAFESGLVNHALSAAIRTLIKDYFVLIAQLDHQFRQGLLTLQKLWFYLQPTKRTLEIVSSIVSAINKANSKGGVVLSLLHEKTSSLIGDSKAQELLLFLTQSACVPYFEVLGKWIYKGIICDPYGEFLVEDNELIQKEDLPIDYSNDYWEKRYTICRERIPAFLEKVSDMILRTGKYVNVIRQCGQDIHYPEAEDIVYTIKEREYVVHIEKAYNFASKKLLDLLIEECDIMGRLKSVKHYFLLDQGDFIVQFMDMADDEMKKNIKDIMPTRLESLLELALRTSVSNSDPYKDDVRVELLPYDLMTQMFKILSIETKDEKDYRIPLDLKLSGLETFSFDYEVKWPLSLILNRKVLACYQMLFRHLFYSKHVERLLCSVWISNKVAKTFPLNDARSYGAAFALRQRMLNFVQNLEYYMMFEVLEPNWHMFLSKMQIVKNVDDVLHYHTDFLNMCLKDCMLTSPELLRMVNALMTECVAFSKFILRMNRYYVEAEMTGMFQSIIRMDEVEDTEPPDISEPQPASNGESFEQHIARFDREFTKLLVALLDKISYLGRDNYNEKLVNILYRLDFNGFYTEDLERLAAERSISERSIGNNNVLPEKGDATVAGASG